MQTDKKHLNCRFAGKSIVIIYLACIAISQTLTCCGNKENCTLVKIDSLLMHDKVDSATVALKSIVYSTLKNSDDIAHYNLLKSEILFRTNALTKDDSIIDISIAHYSASNTKDKLAQAYYIKGRLNGNRNNIKECVRNLKKAESAAKDIDDYYLKSKIYNSIAFYNMNGGNLTVALEHCKRGVSFGEKCSNKDMLTYCLQNMAAIHARLRNEDSAIYYIERCARLLKHLPINDRAILLTNIGAAYEFRDPTKAKEYARKALEIKPCANAYHLLGAIAYREGRTETAMGLLKRGIKTSTELMRTISMTEDLAQYEQKEGNSGEAARLLKMATTMRDSLARKNTADSIAGVMAAHELLQAERDAEAERGNWMAIVAVLASVAVAAALAAVIYLKRTRQYLRQAKVRVEKSERQLNALKEKLAAIKATSKKEADAHRKALAKMEAEHNKAVEALNKAMEETMANGHLLHGIVERGESIAQWKKKEMAWFAEYYMAINKEFGHMIENGYTGLSYRQTTFLILEHLGKTQEETMEMMNISYDNYRKMRSVINTKKI